MKKAYAFVVTLALLGAACGTRVSLGALGDGGPAEAGAPDAGAGACILPEPSSTTCPPADLPVCGCDGTTYKSACEAARVLASSTPGACDGGTGDGGACTLATPTTPICPAVFDPVCGCDGKLYGNDCEAAGSVTQWTPGICPTVDGGDAGACLLETPKAGFCPAVLDPVCGCDGKTYDNDCKAGHSITSWKPGPCN